MLNIIYRLCENETDGNLRDIRPEWFNKINCLRSFLDAVHNAGDLIGEVIFVHDGTEGPLFKYIIDTIENPNIVKINHKDNLKSLLTTFDVEIGRAHV